MWELILSQNDNEFLKGFDFVKQFHDGKLSARTFLQRMDEYKEVLTNPRIPENLGEVTFQILRQIGQNALRENRIPMLKDYTSSPENWRDYWRYRYNGSWVLGKRIVVIKMPGINPDIGGFVSRGINRLLNETGLDIEVVWENIPFYYNIIKNATRDGKVDVKSFGLMLKEVHSKDNFYLRQPYGAVIIADQPITSTDQRGGIVLAESHHLDGYSLISIPQIAEFSRRLDPKYFERIVSETSKHEMTHLLSMLILHHEDYVINGYNQRVPCNMISYNYMIDQMGTCDKCKDAVIFFWKGIQERTGMRFFR